MVVMVTSTAQHQNSVEDGEPAKIEALLLASHIERVRRKYRKTLPCWWIARQGTGVSS
jgi:hypothetical protein